MLALDDKLNNDTLTTSTKSSAKYGDFDVVAKYTCKNGEMVRNDVGHTHENCEDQVLRDEDTNLHATKLLVKF